MKKLLIYQLIFAGLGLVSCKEDPKMPMDVALQSRLSVPVDEKVVKIENGTSSLRVSSSGANVDVLMEKFAKSLATSLRNDDFRSFLKTEAEKKFDGDFDILFSRSKDVALNGKKFKDFFIDNGNLTGAELEELTSLNLKLNIAIPVNIEKWDTQTQAPLVIFVPSNYVENKTPTFLAFDINGNQYLIDAIEEPSVPVIVVGRNERMGYEASKQQGKSLRTSGNYEKVEYIKCPNLSNIEGWSNGAPEIRFDGVVYSISGGAPMSACSNTEYVPSRHHAKDGYTLAVWTATQNLFRWYFDTSHGPNYYLQTFEIDDDGSTQTQTVSVSYQGTTSSYGISYKAQDIKMKGELINSTTSTPSAIADGNIEFRLEN